MAKGDNVTVGYYICEALIRAHESGDQDAMAKVIEQIRDLWQTQHDA